VLKHEREPLSDSIGIDTRELVGAEERQQPLATVCGEIEMRAGGQVRASLRHLPCPECLEAFRHTVTSPRSIDSRSLRRAVAAARRLTKPRRDDSVPSDCRNAKRYRTPLLVSYE